MTPGPLTVSARPLDLAGAGHALYDSLYAALVDQGVELPDLCGLVPGALVAYDGPQFTVNFVSIIRGLPGAPDERWMQPAALRQYYSFEVNLLRAVTTIGDGVGSGLSLVLPTFDAMAADYDLLAADAAALWAAMVSVHASYALAEPGEPLVYGPMAGIGPEGGLAGCRLPVAWVAL